MMTFGEPAIVLAVLCDHRDPSGTLLMLNLRRRARSIHYVNDLFSSWGNQITCSRDGSRLLFGAGDAGAVAAVSRAIGARAALFARPRRLSRAGGSADSGARVPIH